MPRELRRWKHRFSAWVLAAAGITLGCDRGERPGEAPTNESAAPETGLQDEGLCSEAEATSMRLEEELLRLVNAVRVQGVTCGAAGPSPPTHPLQSSKQLACAARLHARGMAELGFFSHRDPTGKRPKDRAIAMGYKQAVAENLNWGQQTPQQALEAWLGSVDHCMALMDSRYRSVGTAHHPGREKGPFWVQLFGAN